MKRPRPELRPNARPDPDADSLHAAARSVGRQIMIVSAIAVVVALALTIAWVLHQTVPDERLEQVAAAGQGEVLVPAVDVVAGLLVLGLGGVVFAGVVAVLIARRAVRPLGEALRRQRQFVADASHELRTPLAVLDARLQALQRRITGGTATADERVVADLDRLRGDSRALIDIIGDLLEAAGGDPAPGGSTEDRSLRLDDVVDDVLASMAVLADDRRIALSHRSDPSGWVAVPGATLRRCVLALVDNALDHAPDGSAITVSVSAEESEGHPITVLRVTDEGAGIAGIDPARIFDRFARSGGTTADGARDAPTGRGRGRSSFGIGLALVREVAVRHGGTVRVAATSPRGTTMELTLPRSA